MVNIDWITENDQQRLYQRDLIGHGHVHHADAKCSHLRVIDVEADISHCASRACRLKVGYDANIFHLREKGTTKLIGMS